MEPLKLFKEYEPIKCIYENEYYLIAFPETDKEPLAVYYDKEFNKFKEVYFYQEDISNDVIHSELIYGNPLKY